MTSSIPPGAYAMVIGAMKSGTSSLFDLLTQHPAICASTAKEPEFFSETQGHRVEVERYEDLFPFDPATHAVCLEASTGYTKYPEEVGVPDRIAAYGLHPRFIYIVRDPVDRIVSQHNFARMNDFAWGGETLGEGFALDVSRYHLQLSQFLEVFPDRSRYRVVDFEDLKRAPADLAASLFAWLGLEPFAVDVAPPRNATQARSEAELALVRSPLHKLRHLLPPSVREGLKSVLRSRGTPATHEPTEAERAELQAALHDDMLRFEEVFGFPVETWGFRRDPSAV
ncbi:MAG: sulfotransferase [Bacteroidota bacterium]